MARPTVSNPFMHCLVPNAGLALLMVMGGCCSAGAQTVSVLTSQYNNGRTGLNDRESKLTPENVSSRTFGKVATLPVDGAIFAQPLYVPDVNVPGRGTYNLLFVATERDTVYAFDADLRSQEPVWKVSLLPQTPASFPVSAGDVGCPFISPGVGVTATPVIDIATGTLYVLARHGYRANFIAGINHAQRLHALAITTGREKFGGPVEIQAVAPGSGAGSFAGRIKFDALRENPRAALLLLNGMVYLTWGSSCDISPYHGWVMAYDAKTLKQIAVFNTSPNAGESGIWQSDTGPAADAEGNVYVATGNGSFDAVSGGGGDYGDSLLKLKLQGNRFVVVDFFTPHNEQELNSTDKDLGSGGPMLLPAKAETRPAGVVFGGKQGILYNADPKHLGGLQRQGGTTTLQTIRLATGIFGAAAYWNSNLYTFASKDWLKQWSVADGRLAPTYSARSQMASQFSGGTPTVSALGSRNGIVWIVESRGWDRGGTQAVLRAFSANDVAQLLYSSEQNLARDHGSQAVRFTIPTVANGRVYVGGVNAMSVYGLLPR